MKKIFLTFLIFILSFKISFGLEKKVYLTSLEWPPFTGISLSYKGLSSYIIQKAFEAEGYNLDVSFYPWARTVDKASTSEEFMGYFPVYYSKESEKEFYFSDPIGESILGFVELKNNSIEWNTLEDLKKYKIGTVIGYANTVEFDKLLDTKGLQIEEVNNDLLNIKKNSCTPNKSSSN